MDEERFAKMKQLAGEFQDGIAKKLQRYLILKSWWSTNYVSYNICFTEFQFYHLPFEESEGY